MADPPSVTEEPRVHSLYGATGPQRNAVAQKGTLVFIPRLKSGLQDGPELISGPPEAGRHPAESNPHSVGFPVSKLLSQAWTEFDASPSQG